MISYMQLYVQMTYNSQMDVHTLIPKISLSAYQKLKVIDGWLYCGSENVDFGKITIIQLIKNIRLGTVLYGEANDGAIYIGSLMTVQCTIEIYYI